MSFTLLSRYSNLSVPSKRYVTTSSLKMSNNRITNVSRTIFRYHLSTNSGNTNMTSSTTNSIREVASKPQHVALKDANAQMQKYHETRELMKQGKLKNLNSKNQQSNSATATQAGIMVVFLIAFMSTPFLGKKIAQDEEFRKKYIPAWYDYTVKRPENPWTRDELHEQMLQVQHDIHTRAIAGEFTPEKLQALQNAMQSPNSSSSAALDDLYHPHRQGLDRSKIPKEWDMVHPGLAADEELDERDS
jgi:hypothetical protein